MSKLPFSLAILCLLVANAPAAEAKRPVAELISALASTDAKQIDKAREELVAMGSAAINDLENHQTEDARVASSIKYVLNRICNYYIRIDPKRGKDIKSPGGNGIQVMLSIKNNTAHAVKLCWVDRTGNRVPYKDIKPGGEIKQRSFEYHCWIILDKDSLPLGIYRSTYQNGRILVEQKFF